MYLFIDYDTYNVLLTYIYIHLLPCFPIKISNWHFRITNITMWFFNAKCQSLTVRVVFDIGFGGMPGCQWNAVSRIDCWLVTRYPLRVMHGEVVGDEKKQSSFVQCCFGWSETTLGDVFSHFQWSFRGGVRCDVFSNPNDQRKFFSADGCKEMNYFLSPVVVPSGNLT